MVPPFFFEVTLESQRGGLNFNKKIINNRVILKIHLKNILIIKEKFNNRSFKTRKKMVFPPNSFLENLGIL